MKTWSFLIKLAVTLVILAFLYFQTSFNTRDFIAVLLRLDYRFFIPALSGVVIVLGIKSYRWFLLIKQEGFFYSAGKAFGAYMSSDAIGIVTPGRIGEIARLYYLRQQSNIGFETAFRTVVSDRIFDLTFLAWFGFSGLLFYFRIPANLQGGIYLLVVLFLLITGFIILKRILEALTRMKKKTSTLRLFPFLLGSLEAATGKSSVKLWLITLVAYLAYFFFSALLMYALGVKPHFIEIAFIMSLMSLATILPVSIAGFGTREASLVLLFTQYGIPIETAISFSLLHFTAFFLLGGLIGLVFWLYMPISLKVVKNDTREVMKLFATDKAQSNN